MKNHEQIYVPKCPRMYENNLLNLLESPIPDISTSILTILSIETLENLCQTVMVSTQNSTADFPVSKIRLMYIISLPEHNVHRMSYCDQSLSVRPSGRPSVRPNEAVLKWLGLARVRVG